MPGTDPSERVSPSREQNSQVQNRKAYCFNEDERRTLVQSAMAMGKELMESGAVAGQNYLGNPSLKLDLQE